MQIRDKMIHIHMEYYSHIIIILSFVVTWIEEIK